MAETTEKKAPPKMESLGNLPTSKFAKVPEWKAYIAAAEAFGKAKTDAQIAKKAMRDWLRAKSPQLSKDKVPNLEFTVIANGEKINLIKVNKPVEEDDTEQETITLNL